MSTVSTKLVWEASYNTGHLHGVIVRLDGDRIKSYELVSVAIRDSYRQLSLISTIFKTGA